MEKIIREIRLIKSPTDGWNFETKHGDNISKIVNGFSKKDKEHIEELLLTCVRSANASVLQLVAVYILQTPSLLDIKSHPEVVTRLFDEIIKTSCSSFEQNMFHVYTPFIGTLLPLIKANDILSIHIESVYNVIRASLTMTSDPDRPIHNAAIRCCTDFPWQDYPDKILVTIKLVNNLVKTNPDVTDGTLLYQNVDVLLSCIFINISLISDGHRKVLPDLSLLFNLCADQDWYSQNDAITRNVCHVILTYTMDTFLSAGNTSADLVSPMLTKIRELSERGDDALKRSANNIMGAMSSGAPQTWNSQSDVIQTSGQSVASESTNTGDEIDNQIKEFLSGKNRELISVSLAEMYRREPNKFHPHLKSFEKMLSSDYGGVRIGVFLLFSEVAKSNPQVLSKKCISQLGSHLKDRDVVYLAAQFLNELADSRLDEVLQYEDEIIDAMNSVDQVCALASSLLIKMAIDEPRRRKFLRVMASRVTSLSTVYQQCYIAYMRTIGTQSPQALAEYRSLFIDLMTKTPELKDVCQHAIDFIDQTCPNERVNEAESVGNNEQLKEDVNGPSQRNGSVSNENKMAAPTTPPSTKTKSSSCILL